MPCLRRGLEELGNLELEELCLRRMAGASRDALTEEIASWSVAADRIALEISGKKKIPEEVEKKTTKDDIKMSGGGMEGIAWLSVIVKVQAWILQANQNGENVVEQQRDGSVRGFD